METAVGDAPAVTRCAVVELRQHTLRLRAMLAGPPTVLRLAPTARSRLGAP